MQGNNFIVDSHCLTKSSSSFQRLQIEYIQDPELCQDKRWLFKLQFSSLTYVGKNNITLEFRSKKNIKQNIFV